jgi:Condensation domain
MSTQQLFAMLKRLDNVGLRLLRELVAQQGIVVDDVVILPEPRTADCYPLSSAQLRIFFLEALNGPSAALNVCSIAKLDDGVDMPVLRQAVELVAERHEVFRLEFSVLRGTPAQRLGSAPRLAWRQLHCDSYQPEQMQQAIDREIREPTSARKGPLLRVLAISVAGGASHIVVTMHHIISDGLSVRLFLRETGRVYAALRNGAVPRPAAPSIQFIDYAMSEHRLQALRQWDGQLESLKQRYPDGIRRLPQSAQRRAPRTGAVLSFVAPGVDWPALLSASQANGVTLFTWLLCAWVIALDRFEWAASLPIAVPITLRQRPELENVIGYLANLVLVPPMADRAGSLAARLKQAKLAVHSAFTAQNIPFEVLIRSLSPARRTDDSMYDLMFEYLDFRSDDVTPAASTLASQRSEFTVDTQTAKCALFLAVWQEAGHLAGAFEFDANLLPEDTMVTLRDNYLDTLHRMATVLGTFPEF